MLIVICSCHRRLVRLLGRATDSPRDLLRARHDLAVVISLLGRLRPIGRPASARGRSTGPNCRVQHGIATPGVSLNRLVGRATTPAPGPRRAPTGPRDGGRPRQSATGTTTGRTCLESVPIATGGRTSARPTTTPRLSRIRLLTHSGYCPIRHLLDNTRVGRHFCSRDVLRGLPFPVGSNSIMRLSHRHLVRNGLPIVGHIAGSRLTVDAAPAGIVRCTALRPITNSSILRVGGALGNGSVLSRSRTGAVIVSPCGCTDHGLGPNVVVSFTCCSRNGKVHSTGTNRVH